MFSTYKGALHDSIQKSQNMWCRSIKVHETEIDKYKYLSFVNTEY